MSLLPPAPRATVSHRHHRAVWLAAVRGFHVPQTSAVEAANPDRRARCRLAPLAFLVEYLPHRFWNPCGAHARLVGAAGAALLSASVTPFRQAWAGPRSFGKTTIGDGLVLWAALYRHKRFPLILGAKADNAEARLAAFKHELRTNLRVREDFPEITSPIDAFRGDPRSAPPDFPWASDRVRLANGVWVGARGTDSSLAGLNLNAVRPDFVLLDDVETLNHVRSAALENELEERLRLEVARLHDINRASVYLWIATIRSRHCLSARLTDPKIEPEWRGMRLAALVQPPTRTEHWQRFMNQCQPNKGEPIPMNANDLATREEVLAVLKMKGEAFDGLTPGYQKALRFYVAHKAEMDEGAVVLDPDRLPLHAIFHMRATEGERAFLCELQNEPPDDAEGRSIQLELAQLSARKIGPPAGVVPRWADRVFCAVDVGKHYLHWEASAFAADNHTSCMIACGIEQTGVGAESKLEDSAATRAVMVSEGIWKALERLAAKFAAGWSREEDRVVLQPRAVGVDCGGTSENFAWYETVLHFCAKSSRWRALKGTDWRSSIASRAGGKQWIVEASNNPGRRHDCNADHFKTQVMTALGAPLNDAAGKPFAGTRWLNSETPLEYLRHQTAERWVEEVLGEETRSGKELHQGWNHLTSIPNHFFDTAWMVFALADMARVSDQAPRRKIKYGIIGRTDV